MMKEDVSWISEHPEGCQVRLWIQPGAKKNELAGMYQGCLKLRLQAPPVDNKANRELIAYLAELLGLKPRQIQFMSGQRSRKKVVTIQMDGQLDIARIQEILIGK
jgi:uncharacterized protein (TIGR00251 family)